MNQDVKETSVSKSAYEYETFDVGNKALILDDTKDKDVFAAIDELGLKGQKSLATSQGGKVIPFPKLSRYELRIWKLYCPTATRLEEFSDQVIPYEILTLLQLVKTKGYFGIKKSNTKEKKTGWLEVWSEAREDVDPLIVGVINTQTKYDWGWSVGDKEYYLLARWGLSLRKFEDVANIAIARWKHARRSKAEAVLATLDHDANQFFYEGRNVPDQPINLDDIPF